MKKLSQTIANYRKLSVAVAVLTVAALPASASLVNGGFDDTDRNFSANYLDPGEMRLFDGSTAISGWTVVAPGLGDNISWNNASNPYGLTASPGNPSQFFLDLTGWNDGANGVYAGVRQSVSTVNGQQYVLKFDVGSDTRYNGAEPGIQVYIDNAPVGSAFYSPLIGLNNWASYSLTFTASGASTDLLLQGVMMPGSSVVYNIGLDNVTLTAVPEPSTVCAAALLAIPAGISALRAWRKNRMSA